MVNHKTYNEDKNPTNHISNSNKYKSKTKQIWRRAMSHKTYDEDKNPKRHISKNKYKLKDRQIPRRAQNNKKTMKRRILRFLELLDIFFTRIMNIIICISFITPFIIAKVTKRIEDLVTISKSNIILYYILSIILIFSAIIMVAYILNKYVLRHYKIKQVKLNGKIFFSNSIGHNNNYSHDLYLI